MYDIACNFNGWICKLFTDHLTLWRGAPFTPHCSRKYLWKPMDTTTIQKYLSRWAFQSATYWWLSLCFSGRWKAELPVLTSLGMLLMSPFTIFWWSCLMLNGSTAKGKVPVSMANMLTPLHTHTHTHTHTHKECVHKLILSIHSIVGRKQLSRISNPGYDGSGRTDFMTYTDQTSTLGPYFLWASSSGAA